MVYAKPSTLRLRREEQWEYRLIFLVSLIVFLVGAVLARLVRQAGGTRQGLLSEPRRSVFGEARAAANTFIPYAFMR